MSAFGDIPPDLDRPGFGSPTPPQAKPPAPLADAAPPDPTDAPSASRPPSLTDATASRPASLVRVEVCVNGSSRSGEVEPRMLLSDFVRHELGLTGTKVGCETGECGSCTVLLDGEPVRSCLTFAVQVDNAELKTVEGLQPGRLQESFHQQHALQCGFCTAGFLMTLDAYLAEHPDPSEQELKRALAGNLCRCTGYKPIIEAVLNR